MYVDAGIGGLGVLVRAGLVMPPSLVRSTVEAALALLIVDRRRDISVARCKSCVKVSAAGLVCNALVKRDSFRLP